MVKSASIVLENPALLADVCGVNDSNLKVIEELIGTRIISRGNEIFLEDGNDEKSKLLTEILDELRLHVELGHSPGPDLIRSVVSSISEDKSGDGDPDAVRQPRGTDLLRTSFVHIPGGITKVFPRSVGQAMYVQGMNSYDMSFGIGPAGTGKTYLAMAHALSEVLSRKKRKLVLTRPVVEAGESLGFLPGDLTQKLNPYLRPLYDAMESLLPVETVRRMEDSGVIEIAPLAYMRGRSLKDCYIILDEAQNTSREQMKMFLTRMGEGSKVVITGDVTQIDLPKKKESGLLHAARVLSDIPEIRFNYFTSRDVVRSMLVRKIIHAYENEQSE
ncbi:MAG TPA: PhoH family protein [Spirochaetia bacterium]|nr:PhoH family protein [Spirochaetia bacterium]